MAACSYLVVVVLGLLLLLALGSSGQRGETEMCLQQGGSCMPTAECGRIAEHQGLCSQGSVCCLELRDPTCYQRGGACHSDGKCGLFLIPGNFRDCGPQDKCCRLD